MNDETTEPNDGTQWHPALRDAQELRTLEGFTFITNHGFNVRDGGTRTLGPLERKLRARGAKVVELDRNWEGLLGAAFGDEDAADRNVEAVYAEHNLSVLNKVVLLGHSHGCNIVHQTFSSERFSPIDPDMVHHCILLNPALRREAEFPVPVTCYHSRNDKVVTTSTYLRVLPWRWFWPHPWGEAGRYGLTGENITRNNVDLEKLLKRKVGHSDGLQSDALVESIERKVTA